MMTVFIVGCVIGFVAVCYWIQSVENRTEDKYKAYRKDGSKWVP